MKRLFQIFVILFMFCAGVNSASAHATPVEYQPRASAVLEKIPDRVRIHFSEEIEPHASGITILAPDGTSANVEESGIDPADAHVYQADVRDAGPGTYTVSWQVASADDGHFTKGSFVFSVGKQSAGSNTIAGQFQIQHITSVPQAMTIWMELLGQALLLGSLIILVGIFQPLKTHFGKDISERESISVRRRITILVIIGTALILLGAGGVLVLKTFDLQQLRGTDFALTFRTFVGTLDGEQAAIRVVLALVFVAGFVSMRRRIFANGRLGLREAFLIACIFGMALSRARASHSAATDFSPVLSVFITSLHLLSKEFWVGGLVAFNIALLPILASVKNSLAQIFSLTGFSKILSIAFGAAGVTGAWIVFIDLKSPEYIFTTEWGAWFIILSIVATILLAFRLYHQVVVETVIVRTVNRTADRRARLITTSARYTRVLEMLIGISLLSVTSFIIITRPPYRAEIFQFEKHSTSQGALTSLRVAPDEPEKFFVTITDEKNHAPLVLNNFSVQLINEEKGIGPIVAKTEERYDGAYVFDRSVLSLQGKWNVHVISQRPEQFDSIADFHIDYSNEIQSTRVDPEHRSFGLFELVLIATVLGMALFALLLYRYSRNLNRTAVESAGKGTGTPFSLLRYEGISSYAFGIAGVILIAGLVWISFNTFFKTDFQKQCERDGNFWLQSVPMRDGVALSSDTLTGCTLNIGLYHFANQQEYSYFLRPRQSMVEIATVPQQVVAGKPTDLTVQISKIEQGQKAGPVEDLGIYHDRILHLLIVGEDLQTFAHIHTEDIGPVTPEMKKQGKFPFQYIFPKAGKYTIVVNYVVGGIELSQQSFMDVAGEPSMEKNSDAVQGLDRTITKHIDGYDITLQIPQQVTVGKPMKLTYVIEKDGKPVTDLQPYLAAAMHLAVVRADLGRVIHTHGQPYLPGSAYFQQLFQNYVNYHMHFVPDRFGPKVQTRVTFPQPGLYVIFGEFAHNGKTVVTRFAVKVK